MHSMLGRDPCRPYAWLIATIKPACQAPRQVHVAWLRVRDVLRIPINDTSDRLERLELWSKDGRLVNAEGTLLATAELDLSKLPACAFVLKAHSKW
ncbi:MAG: hypothetical protein IPH05_10935 [Flavobacteriales bacterium]|jgi:hypothetical protein|nr:hypothetical protein [Flavobacteriales bacterium]MBK6883438.1 hypothetical protein [Flavobacteriales bacterium]MBK7482270.1 hypothetical protein [Flavobacteriales bacterium]MBK8708681.1 hypothetical protein [Flavobacteriales bacterium]